MEVKGFTKRESYESPLYAIEEFSVIGSCSRQEDCTGCLLEGNTSVMVLCDGIGGMERGDLASQTAISSIIKNSCEYLWKEKPTEFLKYLVQEANEAVFSMRDESGRAVYGGCTLVLALTLGRRVFIANVGDSRAYIINRDKIERLTKDHNFSELLKRQLEECKITNAEYEEQKVRGAALTSYLGMGELKESFIGNEPLIFDRDEVLLIISDGLYKLLPEKEIFKIIKDRLRCLDEAGEELLAAAQKHKKDYQDNTSIILFRIK